MVKNIFRCINAVIKGGNMNKIGMQNISFSANPKDFPAIKKACDNLYKTVSSHCEQKQPVDIAEIGGKVHISSFDNNGKPMLKINLTDENGTEAYTLIQTRSLELCRKFLKSQNTPKEISDIIESLKKAVRKASKSESYLG